MTTVRLPFRGPLAFDVMLRYFAARAIPGVEDVSDGAYRRTTPTGVVEVRRGGAHHLVVRSERADDGCVEGGRRLFGLDVDLTAAIAHLGADPLVGPLVAARPGLRVPGAWDPFELGVRAIVGQQVTVAGASTITGRLAARLGDALTVAPATSPRLTHVFPSPDVVAAADLDGLGLTAARVDAVRALAVLATTGTLDGVGELRGIGPWTTAYLALRFGDPDAFPVEDLGLQRACGNGGPLSRRELQAVAERWRPWRALAATHLWMKNS